MKPHKLDVVQDYRPALLWLMDQRESIRMRDALVAFEDAFGDLIPKEHREENNSGRLKWQHYVQWARYDLVNKELMGSGGRGIWTITQAGREWLGTHPDGDLSDWEIVAEQKVVEVGFRWRGQWYAVERKELLDRARIALTQNPPPEALRYRTWAVIIDKQPINIKWLFSLATGTDDYDAFDSPTARRALAQIGIEAQLVGRLDSEIQSTNKTQDGFNASQPLSRAERAVNRDAFLQQTITLVPQHLPGQARHVAVLWKKGWNHVEWSYPEFRGATYELILGRDDDRLGVHFKAAPDHNERRLRVFEPHCEALSKKIGYEVVIEPWGKYNARVIIHLPSSAWTTEQAEAYARLVGRFVEATFVVLRQAFDTVPAGRRAATEEEEENAWSESRPHTILDEQLDLIQRFLQGRASRPSDEVLCDWVQFCYTFERFQEGHDLFKLVVPSEVNDWLYARTKRLAQVCKMRAR